MKDVGLPVKKSDLDKKDQMWERLSIKGIMDRVEHLISIYPFTNAKLLQIEKRRLDAIKNAP